MFKTTYIEKKAKTSFSRIWQSRCKPLWSLQPSSIAELPYLGLTAPSLMCFSPTGIWSHTNIYHAGMSWASHDN